MARPRHCHDARLNRASHARLPPTPVSTPWRCMPAPRPTRPPARARVPIHLTTSFVFENSEHAASLFNMERSGHVYSRISNPTNAVLEERIAALEGGVGAIATASGQAALHLAHRHAGRRRRAHRRQRALYGGSHNLLDYTLQALRHRDHLRQAGRHRRLARRDPARTPRLLFGETLGNPGLDVLDIPTVSAIAHDAGLPLLVDSTFTTPWLLKPFDHGADLIFHSATKFLCGHGTVVGGAAGRRRRLRLGAAHAAPAISRTERALRRLPRHGVHRGDRTVGAFLLRARREGLRDFGACMSPHTAWLILQGIETLPLRMERHVEPTRARWCEFLAAHPVVESVSATPSSNRHPDHALAQRLLPRGCGAVFSFDLKGDRAAGRPSSRR